MGDLPSTRNRDVSWDRDNSWDRDVSRDMIVPQDRVVPAGQDCPSLHISAPMQSFCITHVVFGCSGNHCMVLATNTFRKLFGNFYAENAGNTSNAETWPIH